MSTRKEIETEARRTAHEQIDSFPEFARITNAGDIIPQAARTQQFLVWAKANLEFTEEDGAKVFVEERNKKIEELYQRNLKHLTERTEKQIMIETTSWNILKENFVAIDKNGKPLEITGKIEDAIKERFCVPDEKAITNPSEFIAGLVKNLSNHDFKFETSYFTLKFQRRT